MNNFEERSFFISCPLGLEQILVQEMIFKLGFYFSIREDILKEKMTSPISGGVEILLPLYQGLFLNHLLKVATRVLLRVSEFKCRDFPKLFQKSSKILWSDFLASHDIKVTSSSTSSRVFDGRKIEKTVISGIKQFFKGRPPKKIFINHAENGPQQNIYVRFVDDHCLISIDTSGQRLDQRGHKIFNTKAPLREGIAYALLFFTSKYLENSKNHFYSPMAGSGTFFWETLLYPYCNFSRSFSYQFFPLSYNFHWDEELKNKKIPSLPFDQYFISDMSNDSIQAIEKNLLELTQKYPINQDHFVIEKTDFFNLKSSNYPSTFLINPPYGKRIKLPSKDFYQKIFNFIGENFPNALLGIIIPQEQKKLIDYRPYFEILDQFTFVNGGISVDFWALKTLHKVPVNVVSLISERN